MRPRERERREGERERQECHGQFHTQPAIDYSGLPPLPSFFTRVSKAVCHHHLLSIFPHENHMGKLLSALGKALSLFLFLSLSVSPLPA